MKKGEFEMKLKDIKITDILLLDETTLSIVVNLHCFFQDTKKIKAWLQTKNLNLGNRVPVEMINAGRAKKVLAHIVDTIDKNVIAKL